MPAINYLHLLGGLIIVIGAMQYVWDLAPETEPEIVAASQNLELQSLSLSDLVSLDMKLQYQTLYPPSTSKTQEPVLLSLNVNENVKIERTPADIILVLDTSSSMEGEKIELLQKTLHYLLTLFGENDRVSIVTFNHNVERRAPLLSVNKEISMTLFRTIINGLYASGSTNIAAGLHEALEILSSIGETQGRAKSIFLLTDGLDTYGLTHESVSNLLDSKNGGAFTIHTFGYGADHDPKLMNAIAHASNGNFYFIENFETADESFADALGETVSAIGEKVILSVKAIISPSFPKIKFNKAFGDDLLWKKTEDGWYQTSMNFLSAGKSKNFVLLLETGEFIANGKAYSTECIAIAQAKLSMRDVKSKELIEKEFVLKVGITDQVDEFNRQDIDARVLLNYYRVRAGEAMLESSKLADQGKYEDGRNILEKLQSEIGNSTFSTDGFLVGTVTDLNNTISEMYAENYHTLGKLHIQQNSGSYISERSNPYSNNSALSYNTTNNMQGQLVNLTRATRNFTNGTAANNTN